MTETTATGTTALNRATPNLNKALSQLQGELPKVAKTKEAKIDGQTKDGRPFSIKYGYADLADVTETVGPLLAKYGLAFHAAPTRDPADRREMILAWSLLHESGEERTGEWPLGPANQKPQSLGSAITYGRRYCLGAATGIVAEDDDDGQSAQQDHGNRQSAADAFENAAPRANGNGRQGGQVSRPAAVAQEPAAGAGEPDEAAQEYAVRAQQARMLAELQEIHGQAREAGKLTAIIRNPATGNAGKLALYIDWRRKQLADVEKAMKELNDAAQAGGIDATALDGHVKRILGGTGIEDASAAELRQAARALRERAA